MDASLNSSLTVEFECVSAFPLGEPAKVLTQGCIEDIKTVGTGYADDPCSNSDGGGPVNQTALVDKRVGHPLALTAKQSNENDNRDGSDRHESESQESKEEKFEPEVHALSLFRIEQDRPRFRRHR